MLLIALALSLVSVLSSAITAAAHWAYYDDSPAIVVRDATLVKSVLRSGEPISYTFSYDKRVDCHPPLGASDVSYRIWHYPKDGSSSYYRLADYSRPSRALPGRNFQLKGPSIVPLPTLSAGEYAMQFVAEYRCQRASKDQTIEGPMLRFSVIE